LACNSKSFRTNYECRFDGHEEVLFQIRNHQTCGDHMDYSYSFINSKCDRGQARVVSHRPSLAMHIYDNVKAPGEKHRSNISNTEIKMADVDIVCVTHRPFYGSDTVGVCLASSCCVVP
jgi:hypothetical protein